MLILHCFILARKTKAKEYMPRNQWKGLELVASKVVGERWVLTNLRQV